MKSTNVDAQLHGAPLAIASDGTVLLNAARLVVERADLAAVIEQAKLQGGPIFVGLALTLAEVKTARHDLNDAVAEIAARIGGCRSAGKTRP